MMGTSRRERLVNAFTISRMAAAPVALLAAFLGETAWFAWIVAFGLVTDAIDGPLARRLKTASPRGARLDSRADLTFNSAGLVGVAVLFSAQLAAEWPLVATAVVAYAGPMAAGWFKFGRLTSYHTRLARASLVLCPLALGVWLGFDTLFPLQTSVAVLVLSGIEELAITWKLDRPIDDVAHVFQVLTLDSRRRETCVPKVYEN
jgi:phosphatidylglycerophosphate synthase